MVRARLCLLALALAAAVLAPLAGGTVALAEVSSSVAAGSAGVETTVEPCDGHGVVLEAALHGRVTHSAAEAAGPARDLGPSNRFAVRSGTSPAAAFHEHLTPVDLAELSVLRV